MIPPSISSFHLLKVDVNITKVLAAQQKSYRVTTHRAPFAVPYVADVLVTYLVLGSKTMDLLSFSIA